MAIQAANQEPSFKTHQKKEEKLKGLEGKHSNFEKTGPGTRTRNGM